MIEVETKLVTLCALWMEVHRESRGITSASVPFPLSISSQEKHLVSLPHSFHCRKHKLGFEVTLTSLMGNITKRQTYPNYLRSGT